MAEPAVLGVPDTPESVEAHRAFATTGILEGTKEPEPVEDVKPEPAPVDTSKDGEQTTNPTEPGDKSPAPPDPK
jgi:hypothetical protein